MSAGKGSDAGVGRFARLTPGIGVLVALAGAAALIASFVPGVSALLLGVLFRAVVANTVDVSDWACPGVNTQKLLLKTGIILLDARITVDELVASGSVLVRLVVVTVTAGVLLIEAVAGRVLGLADKTGSLLTAGTGICDVSAATAIAGTINADGESLTHVVAATLLFNVFTLTVLPIAGDLLPLSGRQLDIWAGLNMSSTGSVTAAGFAHSEIAGRWATATELARNSILGFVTIAYTVRYAGRAKEAATGLRAVFGGVPRFLVGSVTIAAVANLGLLSGAALATVGIASDALFVLALVGLSLNVRLNAMQRAGVAPLAVLGVQLLTINALTLAAVLTLF